MVRVRELNDFIKEYQVETIHDYGVEIRLAKRTHVIIPWHRVIDISWMDESQRT